MSVPADPGRAVLVRHGQTEWSRSGRHTGDTDLDLTPAGEDEARALGVAFRSRRFAAVLVSPRLRARRTVELAGLESNVVGERGARVLDDLDEWDYGSYEGLTSVEIRAANPTWNIWTDGCPGGESPQQVAARGDRVVVLLEKLLAGGDVAVVSHGHMTRALAARWAGQDVAFGGRLAAMATARVSELGWEHGRRAICTWSTQPAA